MTHDEAFEFFRCQSVLPNDEDLPEGVIKKFEEVRKLLKNSPNSELLKLYFTAFGDGSGFGVYQVSDDALRSHDKDAIQLALRAGMESGNPGAVYWCLHFFSDFPDDWQKPYVYKYLDDENGDLRCWAAMAITSGRKDDRDILEIGRRLKTETDDEILDILRG